MPDAAPLLAETANAAIVPASTPAPPLDQWVLRITSPPQALARRLQPDSDVIRLMQRLVAIVEVVRSPEAGWHSDREPTPENLLPYVTEEACDLLEVLETSLDSQPSDPTDNAESWLSQHLWQDYCLAEDFGPQLLWGIARSSYTVMRLLEGIRAKILPANNAEEPAQTGILRLAALLHLDVAHHPQTVDLVTRHPPQTLLSPDISIQLLDIQSMHQPRSAQDLLTTLVQDIRVSTPAILSFLEGVDITALTPHAVWQTGTLRLQMALEFVPEGDRLHAILPSSQLTETGLQFTDALWLETYRSTTIQQQFASLIPQLLAYRTMSEADLPPLSEDILPLLVEHACELADLLAQTPPFLLTTNPSGTLALSELLPWLLWCVGRCGYEVMHLIGGLPCQLLQPKTAWQSGILRLLLTLKLETPDRIEYIDLATGCTPEPDVFPLDSDFVVRSPNSPWCQHPTLIQYLQDHTLQQIQTRLPELAPLLDGTTAYVRWPDTDPQTARVQLAIDFDFQANMGLTPLNSGQSSDTERS